MLHRQEPLVNVEAANPQNRFSLKGLGFRGKLTLQLGLLELRDNRFTSFCLAKAN